jgi:hypothetical protein
VLYIGPSLSHLSELLSKLNSSVSGHAEHDDVKRCVEEIRRIESLGARGDDRQYGAVAASFYQNILIQSMLVLLEGRKLEKLAEATS